MRQIPLFLIATMVFCLLSCGGGGGNSIDPDDPIPSTERIEVPNVTILPEGGEKEVTVNANCAWVISVPATDSWLSVNPMSGANIQTITISCAENTSSNSRTSVVSISGKQRSAAFTVTQKAKEIIAITISNFTLGTPTTNSVDYSFSLSPVSDDISACGVCCSTSNTDPTIADITTLGDRTGNTVKGQLSSLNPNTTYHVRAYVTSGSGTFYSQTREVVTINNIPGRDDNTTPTVN